MLEQTSRLAIIIDSTGAESNAESLTSALAKVTGAGERAATSANKVTKATDEEKRSLSELLDRIDPVNAALNRLDKQQQELSKFKSKGMIDADTFAVYSKQIEDTRNKLTGFNEQLSRTGMTAKQTAANMRMVPAQMTDIVVSLASGQAPLTVLLQQGGQLKDMFGGVGPAIGALGKYTLGLIGPVSGLAAVAGTLAFAWYQNEDAISRLNKSASTLNNVSGLSLNQMKSLAQASSALGVSYSNSIDSISSLSKAINTNTDLYPRAIKAASDYAWASGQDLPEVVSLFNQLSANGGKSIEELDDKFSFLTVSQRKQADEALRSGNIADAQRIAFEGLSGTLESLTSKLNQGATGWDSFWKSVGKGASGGWQTIKEIAGGDYFDNADVRKYLERSQLRDQKTLAGTWTREDERYYRMLNQSSPAVREYNQAQQSLADTTRKAAGERYLKNLSDQVNDNADAVTRSRKALQALDNQFKSQPADVRSSGMADYSARRAQLEKSLKDAIEAASRKPREKSYTEDAGTRMLDQLRQQQQVLLSQADTGEKIGTQQQALIKWEQQLSDLKSKVTLTADQKSLLANQDKITALYQQNAALEKQSQLLKQASQLSGYQSDLERYRSSRQLQYGAEELTASGAMSSYQQGILTQRASLEQQLNDKLIQLRQQRTSATTDIDKQTIDKEITMQQEANSRMLADYDKHITQMDQSRRSFSAGASRAWNEYQDGAANASAMSQQLFSSAFSGMEDAIVKFATTGKASFKDFATSVISDLARIAARQAIAGIGSSIFGSVLSAGVSAATGSVGSTPSGAYNNAAAGLKFNAKGGVYDSPSLSSYSNGVYDKPQFFAFAKGAGVFGEAGPEAIMPLARSSDGSLGVRMLSGGNGAGANITVNAPVTIVQEGGSNSGEANNTSTANTAQQLSGIVQTVITDRLKKEISPGGMLYRPA